MFRSFQRLGSIFALGRVGRPYLRWDDCLQELAGSEWTEEAKDENLWYALSEGYIFRLWL